MELTSDGSFARTNPSCALYLAASSVPSPLDANGLLQERIDTGGAGCRVGAGCAQCFPLGDVSSVCIWVVLCVCEDVIASAGADGRGVGLLDGDAKMIGHLGSGDLVSASVWRRGSATRRRQGHGIKFGRSTGDDVARANLL